jgi:hypothetical protein
MSPFRIGLRPIASAWRNTISRRNNSTYEPPTAPKPNRHGGFYKEFGPPVIKNFLIALCTFQAIYWSWLKLESIEAKRGMNENVQKLEDELRTLTKDEKPS